MTLRGLEKKETQQCILQNFEESIHLCKKQKCILACVIECWACEHLSKYSLAMESIDSCFIFLYGWTMCLFMKVLYMALFLIQWLY